MFPLKSVTQVAYAPDGNECLATVPLTTRQIVVWNHDESTYYANDPARFVGCIDCSAIC